MVVPSALPAAATVEFNIETKIVPREVGRLMPDPARFAKLVVDVVKKYKLESRVIVQSFDHRSLVEVRKLSPKIRIAALLAEDFPDWESVVAKLKPDYLSPNVDWITPDAVKKAHARKVKVVPWTLNAEADWIYALGCDVDGIISDDPAPLLAFLRSQGKHR
jgi:glycerophosphoryl diester phosphodiesterase